MRLCWSKASWAIAAMAGALIAVLAGLSDPAAAARRAFIVGNATYRHTTSLPNAANDARDLAARLESLGYSVTLEVDVDRTGFLRSFQTFARSLGADDVALLYFAGHGMQIGGENFLFPVDAQIEKEADARERLVPLNALLADVSRATRTRIVILDACRDNPFAESVAKSQPTRSGGVSRGLARVYAGVGSFIAYSTQPGNTALDGTGRNSPFTDALLRHINAPGADVHAVMRRVRGDVQRATAEQQIPWENSSLVDEVAFAGVAVAMATAPSASTAPAAETTKPTPRAQPSRPAAAPAQTYSYVTGLDPDGDNFLALRTRHDAEGVRIATMGPDTLLKVVESRGAWRRVELLDGQSGWAHSNWIACCRTIEGARSAAAVGVKAPPSPPPAPPAVDTCESLWKRRNAIWHRYGLCFTTTKGQQVFGNAGCSRDQPAARAAMSAADRATVDALTTRERDLNCR